MCTLSGDLGHLGQVHRKPACCTLQSLPGLTVRRTTWKSCCSARCFLLFHNSPLLDKTKTLNCIFSWIPYWNPKVQPVSLLQYETAETNIHENLHSASTDSNISFSVSFCRKMLQLVLFLEALIWTLFNINSRDVKNKAWAAEIPLHTRDFKMSFRHKTGQFIIK